MAEPARVQKAIANAGLMSRRSAENAISDNRVTVNGAAARLGDRVDVDVDIVTLDGIPIPVNPSLETHLLYKPLGVISTANDPHSRTTVVDLIDTGARLYPVGRLDADSEGLILLSNDGELTNRVTHPRYGITKIYLAMVTSQIRPDQLRRLTSGIDLEDGPARAKHAHVVDRSQGRTLIQIVMVEGRNREIRRMFDAIGHEIKSLVRTAIGPITDPSLKSGNSRKLTINEIRDLVESGSG
jgi:23S rRNA pseudouridine2605 synthase